MRWIGFAPQAPDAISPIGLAQVAAVLAALTCVPALPRQAGALPADNLPSEKMTAEKRKAAVLNAPPALLRALGSHLIAGYDRPSQLAPLLARGALGGVFVTARNAKGHTKQELAAEISRLRALSAENQRRDLWIATDQEGGGVARLSPPLPHQRSMSRLLYDDMSHGERVTRVHDYAVKKASALSAIGVNLNFAPVVDLKRPGRLRGDRQTNLHLRAISSDAGLVAQDAKSYCRGSASKGVLCTLKHFPGLRTVDADTHITKARILASLRALEARDLAPFWVANTRSVHAAIMIGHAELGTLDAGVPASISKAVISGLLRREWGFQGLVITDDLYMAAIRNRPGGMPNAAVEALNAGADLILITPGGNAVYDVLHALIEAYRDNRLDRMKLAASSRRLDRYAALFPTPAPQIVAAPPPEASPLRTSIKR